MSTQSDLKLTVAKYFGVGPSVVTYQSPWTFYVPAAVAERLGIDDQTQDVYCRVLYDPTNLSVIYVQFNNEPYTYGRRVWKTSGKGRLLKLNNYPDVVAADPNIPENITINPPYDKQRLRAEVHPPSQGAAYSTLLINLGHDAVVKKHTEVKTIDDGERSKSWVGGPMDISNPPQLQEEEK